MKKVFSLFLSITFFICVFTVGAEAKGLDSTKNIYEDRFINYLYGDIADEPDFVPDYEKYEEVYYHFAQNGEPDWVIVNAHFGPVPGICHGIFGFVALLDSSSFSPFSLGLGVYDVQADTFYSLAEAWNMEFSELHESFYEIMSSGEPISEYYSCCLLGDVDKDGKITTIDATHIQRCEAGSEDLQDDELNLEHSASVYGPDIKYISDFNCDGKRDIIDVTCIQRHLVGLTYPRFN